MKATVTGHGNLTGRAATKDIRPGNLALSVGLPPKPAPSGWEWTALSDVATMATGHTPSRKKPEFWEGDVPWMSVKDARPYHGKSIMDTNEHTNELGIENSAAVLLPADTVCLSRTGSIGYSVMLGKPMATSQGFVNWICGKYLVPRFLQLLFVAENPFLHSISEGVAHTTIYFPEAKAFHICLPPLAEQQRIVAKIEALLSQVNTSREKLAKVPEVMKQFRTSVLKSALEGGLTKDWRSNNPEIESAKVLLQQAYDERCADWEAEQLKKMKAKGKVPKNDKWKSKYKGVKSADESEFMGLHEGWTHGKLGDLIYIAARIGWRGLKADEYTEEGPLFLSVHNLNKGEHVNFSNAYHISEERYIESPEIQLQNDDILLVKDGAGIGKIGIVKGLETEATVNSSLLVIRGGKTFVPEFLFYYLKGPDMQRIVRERITGSATPHLFQRDIKQFELLIPPYKEQQEIVRQVEALFKQADEIEKQVATATQSAEQITQSILAKAFRGELVPQDPNDEPASVLLEKIKAERKQL